MAENLSHIFDRDLRHFQPERKIYVATKKIMKKLLKFLVEISGGDRAKWSK